MGFHAAQRGLTLEKVALAPHYLANRWIREGMELYARHDTRALLRRAVREYPAALTRGASA